MQRPSWEATLDELASCTPDDLRQLIAKLDLKVGYEQMERTTARFQRSYAYDDTLVDSRILINRALCEADRQKALLEVLLCILVGEQHPAGHQMVHTMDVAQRRSFDAKVARGTEAFLTAFPTFLPHLWGELFPGPRRVA